MLSTEAFKKKNVWHEWAIDHAANYILAFCAVYLHSQVLDCAPVFTHPSGEGVSPATDGTVYTGDYSMARYPAVVGLVCHLHHSRV